MLNDLITSLLSLFLIITSIIYNLCTFQSILIQSEKKSWNILLNKLSSICEDSWVS